MFKHLFTNKRTSTTRLFLTVSLGGSLILLTLLSLRQPAPHAAAPAGNGLVREAHNQNQAQNKKQKESSRQQSVPRPMVGEAARKYLQQPGEGRSLMQAIAAARFGLKSQKRGPFGEAGGGYLGLSHDQNLNAWFAEDGVTVRPTVVEQEREHSWRMDLRLKAYGYGTQLVAAPPIVSHRVKGNRMEYERSNFGLRNANFEFRKDSFFNPQSAISTPQLVEWYENRAEGIEQGFTIAARPEPHSAVATVEPLRLVVSLQGDLRARAKNEGRAIELTDAAGKRALSYSKLTAQDADGKQLAARMEASADGSEIALVVDDRSASYPIVIDPIVASLEKILDAGSFRQSGAQFGDAVAIDGDRAVVGAWLEDFPDVDNGVVYFFSRTGSTWQLVAIARQTTLGSHSQCGYSVAISGNKAAFGCPGANSNTGKAFVFDFTTFATTELIPDPTFRNIGEFFGASVAISAQDVVVGAPFSNLGFGSNDGQVHIFSTTAPSYPYEDSIARHGVPNGLSGFGVAVEGDTIVVGRPGVESVDVFYRINGVWQSTPDILTANDRQAGDLFGDSLALSGNTAVISAPGDDDKGTDAGAAYVFVRDASGQWSQQQKLTASNGKANDIFSYFSVAIQGSTIVVGARRNDGVSANPNDNRGAAYIFTRSGTVWTQQTTLGPAPFFGAPGDEYGTSVGISGDTVIVSAPHAAALDGTANSGTTYVYRLDCVPPGGYVAGISVPPGGGVFGGAITFCPGLSIILQPNFALGTPISYQWRKNGQNIPGATSRAYPIARVSISDAGVYDVILSNACGSEISVPVTLGVHSFSLSPNQNFSATGSPGIVNVTCTGICGWTAVSNAPFITITSGQTGTAPGTVGFTVAGNTGPNQRTGTITIADQTFTVTQDGLNCSYAIAPAAPNFSAGSNAGGVNVTATAGCAWTAISNDSWLTITSGSSGTGNGTVNYSVAANTGPARTGTITVVGQTVTVTQANGCTYSLSPTAQNFPASIAAGASNVTTTAGCAWTAVNNSPSFITITSGASGNGNGSVGYSVTANNTTNQRTGTITIAGQTFTVTQDGAAPLVSNVQFSASTYNVGEGDSKATITVTRTGDTSGTATVDYQTSDLSAEQRTDYTIGAGSITFSPGETSKSFVVLIVNDVYIEGNEVLNLTLSNPTGGAVLSSPSVATLTIVDDDSASAPTNPIDVARFFVQQHYYDFLSRTPDTGGWDFWTGRITQCGNDATCLSNSRIAVSNAYFYELEYQQTGAFVFRLYRAAFGNSQPFPNPSSSNPTEGNKLPNYAKFAVDRARVVGGSSLAQGQLNFATAFVQRDEFKNKYSVGLDGPGFVDALLLTIKNDLGVDLSSQRAALLDLFNQNGGGFAGRGAVLYRLADDNAQTNPINNRAIIDEEYNRAFVATQYFGYLRRNPDIGGFLFWLAQVSSAPLRDATRQQAMVCSFITSAEYQQRFSSVVTHTNAECSR